MPRRWRHHLSSNSFRRVPLMAGIVVCCLGMAGCPESDPEISSPVNSQSPDIEAPMGISLSSTAFEAGKPIPAKYTSEGEDVSPPLSWQGAPRETQQFALICDDPDAPRPQPWVHWLIYQIPGEVTSLPEGLPTEEELKDPVSARQGKNTWEDGQTMGYRGPEPPPGHGVHHYHFKLFALDAQLDLPPGMTKSELLNAIETHVIDSGELIGTYER